MSYEPLPRWQQQLGGAIVAALGGCGTLWTWHTALNEGYYYSKAAMLLPAFVVLGLALVAIPGYKEERLRRWEDISGLSGMRLITPRWWAVVVVAVAAGFGNSLLLEAR